MGSNQSSSFKEPQSFTIDPNGNITRRPASSNVASSLKQDKQQTTIAEQISVEPAKLEPALDEATAVSGALVEPTVVAPVQERDLSLAEAEQIVDSIQTRYKQKWASAEQASNVTAEELERKIVQCYRSNPNQTMNCSALYKNYQDYVVEKRRELLTKNAPNSHVKVMPQLVTTVLVIITCLLLHLSTVHCLGAMSVDLGSEWMKVGLVAPSVQMDIVLNAQSQRKTPMAIGFSNGERFIGDPALDVAGKYPDRVYTHFIDLLGKETVEHPSVLHYKTRFPYAKISNPPASPTPPPPPPPPPQTTDNNSNNTNATSTSKSIILNHPEGLEFTPLELIAMMLQHANDQVANVLKTTDQVATDVVITVPPYFNSKERQLVLDAAKLAGLNVLRLTNSNSAFALSYGIFRHHEYLPRTNENKTTILFFDQGASQTSATLADYHLLDYQQQPITANGAPTNESLPTITVRAQVFDRYVGGFDMQLKLRDHLIRNFCQLNKIAETQVRNRGRSISKLLKEAGRVKKILSANTDHTVRVENVINDIDLKQFITRKEFEELNREYMEDRIVKLLDRLFEMPGVTRDEHLESVIIVGGNTRTPKIQQTLQEYFKLQALGKSINGDEGAAMAALYQAASHGRGFRVKKFVLEEFNSTTLEETVEAQPIDSQTFEVSRVKLTELREKDQLRLERLSLKNALESILGEAREKLSTENPDDELKKVKDKLEKDVKEASIWLEEGPVEELNNITTLTEKLKNIQDMLHPPPPFGLPPNFLDLSQEQLESIRNKTMSILSKLNETVTPEEPSIEPTPSNAEPSPPPPHTDL